MTKNVPEKTKVKQKECLLSCEITKDENGDENLQFCFNSSLFPENLKSKREYMDYAVEKLFGTSNFKLAMETANRAAMSLPHGMTDEEKYNLIFGSSQEMKPKDILEARLCTKETTLYTTAMQYMMRAERNLESNELGSNLWHETYMNYAIKLLRLHNETVQTLDRLRRKEQRIVVQHVTVNDGGQAAILTKIDGGGGVK